MSESVWRPADNACRRAAVRRQVHAPNAPEESRHAPFHPKRPSARCAACSAVLLRAGGLLQSFQDQPERLFRRDTGYSPEEEAMVNSWLQTLVGLSPAQQGRKAAAVWRDASANRALRERAAYLAAARPASMRNRRVRNFPACMPERIPAGGRPWNECSWRICARRTTRPWLPLAKPFRACRKQSFPGRFCCGRPRSASFCRTMRAC